MPLTFLLPVLCPVAAQLASPSAADLRPWGVGSPVIAHVVGGKSWYGTPAGESASSANFGVSWLSSEADAAQANAALVALEAAWQRLIEDDGWQPPAGSDRYLIWVVLNPYLGADGAVSPLPSPEFPVGMTVISLNPDLSAESLEAAAAHQLHHAIQERLRPSDNTDTDGWYREASAVWAQALAFPSNPRYLDATESYVAHPALRYDSPDYGHDAGMYLLNAYLERDVLGPGGMHAVWTQAAERPDVPWRTLIADLSLQSTAQLFGGFSQSVLRQSSGIDATIPPVAVGGSLGLAAVGGVGYLGTEFWVWEGIEATGVSVNPMFFGAELQLISEQEVGDLIRVEPGEVFGVMATTDAVEGYILFLEPPPLAGTPGVVKPELNRDATLRPPTSDTQRTARGCAHVGNSLGAWWLMLGLGLLRRRTSISRR